MASALLFITAGLLEIGGGYLVWLWLREGKVVWVGIVGFLLLAAYGVIPVFQPKEHPFGRVYGIRSGVHHSFCRMGLRYRCEETGRA